MLATAFSVVMAAVGLIGIVFPLTLIVLSCSRGALRFRARALCMRFSSSALTAFLIGITMGGVRIVAGEWSNGLADVVIALLYLWLWWIGGGSGWFRKKAERVAGIVKETVAGRLTVAPAPSPA
jgi:hypothetical protein